MLTFCGIGVSRWPFIFWVYPQNFGCTSRILARSYPRQHENLDTQMAFKILMKHYYLIKLSNNSTIFSLFSVKNKFSYAYAQEFPYRFAQISECEFYLLENLDCCLIVYQPYRPLLLLLQDIGQEEQQLLGLAWRIVNDSLRTDVCLLYPPYLIAISKFSFFQT